MLQLKSIYFKKESEVSKPWIQTAFIFLNEMPTLWRPEVNEAILEQVKVAE